MGGRDTYPELPGVEARRRIDQERKLDEAIEEAEIEALVRAMGPALRGAGIGLVGKHPGAIAEAKRVRALLDRDKIDAITEEMRRNAEIQVESGEFKNLADTVIPPTREQLASGEYEPFYPRQPDGTVREVRTHRRRQAPQAYKMMLQGVINYEGLLACVWYRTLYEMTGLLGSISAVDYQREVLPAFKRKVMFTDKQMDAQDDYRRLAQMIRSRHRRLLDAVVIEDIPINRAVRKARAFHRNPKPAFAEAVEQLINARDVLRQAAA